MDTYPNEEVTDKILTVPNVITLVRFLLIPLYLWLLFGAGMHTAALVVFVIAACTDWVDGQVARRTHQVSKVGKLFDPFVDRFLIASGVVSIYLLGRIPLWMLIFLIARDIIILIEGRISLGLMGSVPKVSYVGKFATAFIMFGFAFLFLGMPSAGGLGLVEASWLPGFGAQPALFGMYLLYIGIILSFIVFCIYQYRGISGYVKYRKENLA